MLKLSFLHCGPHCYNAACEQATVLALLIQEPHRAGLSKDERIPGI